MLPARAANVLASGGLLSPGVAKPAGIEASAAIDDITWLPAWRLRDMIAAREISSVMVVRHFLGRIEDYGPRLNAFRDVDAPGALEQAARADNVVRSGAAPGPLHGVPIAVKELFCVKGFPVPGSYFSYLEDGRNREHPCAARDDIEIERLRAAGAVIIGTTVAALGAVPNADPARLPRNPWNLSRTSGGSSAGNAAAVAGGLVPMAIGDDGMGSVRLPSAFCGILGLHPTRGRIPHIDYRSAAARATVTVGPMTRNVRDAALAMRVLAGPDGRDFVCLQDSPPDYLRGLDAGVKGMRFLWTDDFGFASLPEDLQPRQTISVVRDAAQLLSRVGATVTQGGVAWESPLLSWLAAQQLTREPPVTLDHAALSESDLVAALRSRQRNWETFQKVFGAFDFVISPTVQFAAPAIEEWIALNEQQAGQSKHAFAMESYAANTMMCNVLGIPAISIPVGFVDRMPVALQVIGRHGSERELLQVAQAVLVQR
jgi:Asp-tRNA(Asn)/Glu-tRNA(Gln) amidotransferase A subunit family amidase